MKTKYLLFVAILLCACGNSPKFSQQDQIDAADCSTANALYHGDVFILKYASASERSAALEEAKASQSDMTVKCGTLSEGAYKALFEGQLANKLGVDEVSVSDGKLDKHLMSIGNVQYSGSVSTENGTKKFLVYLTDKDGFIVNIAR